MNKASIFLYGPSGSGKSTVGRILAKNLNLPFVDLDVEIEIESGKPIPEIFEMEGETGFRAREMQTISRVLSQGARVVALGGGTLTISEVHRLVENKGRVVMLDAKPEILLARLQADSVERPLLTGDEGVRLDDLLSRRRVHYESFELRVDTTGKSPEDAAWEIQVCLGVFHLRGMASVKNPGYDVFVQPGGLALCGQMLKDRGLRGPVAVVTDENVGPLYLDQVTNSISEAGYDTRGITIRAGEDNKTLETVSQLWDAFLSLNIERGSTVVALGGGVVGDLAGFAAAAFLRGVAWVTLPTTLLAMVDASMGGKTGADLPVGKNLVGAFHPPRLVLADPNVLATLPEVEIRNGMAEVLKHGVIGDPTLFTSCQMPDPIRDSAGLSKIVCRGMAVKVKIIEEDPFECGLRAALNLGHTVGHGVELVSGFQLKHGESVAIGMVVEARMSERIGLADEGLSSEIEGALQQIGLPTKIPPGLEQNAIANAMLRDKKAAGSVIKFALPVSIGEVRVGTEVDDWRDIIRES